MSIQEFATIASAIKAAWPNANIMPDKQSKEVWYTMLSDLDYHVCLNAVKRLISTNVFAPSIAEIRKKCVQVSSVPEADWGEAWGRVIKAIGAYGYMREEEALESLDEPSRTAVKRIGWQNICHSENIAADRANFRMIYEADQKNRNEAALLPESVRDQQMKIRQIVSGVSSRIEEKS